MEKNTFSRKISPYFFLLLIMGLLAISSCNKREEKKLVDFVYVIEKAIRTPADIVPVTNPQVTPYIYTNTCSLDTLPVQAKKQKFFDLMLPSVLVAKTNLDITRQKVEKLAQKKELTASDKVMLEPLYKKFRTRNLKTLIRRLYTFPVSIVLAQAAIESGWGTSRFFLKGNNPFGIWSFNPNHKRIAANSTRNGTQVFLRKFDNLEQAIDYYYVLLATGKPFAGFRRLRMQTNNPDTLIQALKMYSERRESYVDDLALVIRTSHLKKYDDYKIAPDFLRKERTLRLFPE